MNNERIEKLEAIGFKRWTKGTMDRLYVDSRRLGLEVGYYKTGNVSWAKFEGASISNSEARRLLGAKTFVDVKTDEVHSTHPWLKETVEKMLGGI